MTDRQITNAEQSHSAFEPPSTAANTNPPQIKKKKKRRIFYIFLALILLCFGSINDMPLKYFVFPFLSKNFYGDHWIEEVKLNDGTIINVKRGVVGDGIIQFGKRSFKTKGEYIEVSQYYSSSYSTDSSIFPIFFSRHKIVLFDKTIDGKWYLLVYKENKYNARDCLEYKQYAVIDGKWQMVELDKLLHKRKRNLLWKYEEKIGVMPEIIMLKEKKIYL